MTMIKKLISLLALLVLVACGGGGGGEGAPAFSGGGSGGGTGGAGTGAGVVVPVPLPTLGLDITSTSISAASPATVTATVRNAQGNAVPGQIVTFSVVRGLAKTNVQTQLTDTEGRAVVVLSPTQATSAGADEVVAKVSISGNPLESMRGFQVQATAVSLDAFSADLNPLPAYGQTTLTLTLTGASVTSPVNITVSSSCVLQGKATLSPADITATSNTVFMQYRDNGCGAVQVSDQLQATVTATGAARTLTLPIAAPRGSSIAFIGASPEQIFLRGSGFVESSLVSFEARDAAGNALPGLDIELRLQTGAGGVTMEGRGVESVNPASANPVILRSNAQGRVTARVNSGTLPTPVRINARLRAIPDIATVSSNLSVAIGLPSQLNFSLSQGTKNIEGYNIDGTANTYQIIAADRSGNPVPVGTSVNFVTEGGQIEAVRQIAQANGISRTVANFVSSEPRPVDGRVTIVAYALGEESFVDLNGNNTFDFFEPFQDLGDIFKDRVFDGFFDARDEEFIPLEINNASTCVPTTSPLLGLSASIPSVPGTCDGRWSGAGQVYVRRAAETVLSTSSARPLWADTSRLSASCRKVRLQDGPAVVDTNIYTVVAGDSWYGGSEGVLTFIVADNNPGRIRRPFNNPSSFDPLLDYVQFPRLNPMAAGTLVTATTVGTGLTVTVAGGSRVPDTLEASLVGIGYTFNDPAVSSGVINITFTSPAGLATTVSVAVLRATAPPSLCPSP